MKKAHCIVNQEDVLTPEEKRDLKQAWKEHKEGKTISLSKLKKELGL